MLNQIFYMPHTTMPIQIKKKQQQQKHTVLQFCSKTLPSKCVKFSVFFVQELVQMELKKSRDILFFLLLTGM